VTIAFCQVVFNKDLSMIYLSVVGHVAELSFLRKTGKMCCLRR